VNVALLCSKFATTICKLSDVSVFFMNKFTCRFADAYFTPTESEEQGTTLGVALSNSCVPAAEPFLDRLVNLEIPRFWGGCCTCQKSSVPRHEGFDPVLQLVLFGSHYQHH
jgi:hypothetical protein